MSAKPVIALLVVAATVGGYAYWRGHEANTDADAATTLVLHGNVDIREVQLAFNGQERIAAMHAEEGERVDPGQVLATLETRRLEQAVARAKARVEAQREVLAGLEAGTRPEEIRRARAAAQATRIEAANALRNWQRVRDLAQRELAPRERADNAKAAYEAAAAQSRAARETLNLALAGPRKEDIGAARARLRALEAEYALAREALADSMLKAPSAGVIRERLLEPGDMASPQTPAYTLALTDPVWVRAYVPEPDLGRIRLGQPARVHTDSFPDKHYRAWVGYLAPTAEFTPKSVETERVRTDLVFRVRVFVCNPDDELRLGMPATVTLDPAGSETPAGDVCAPAP